jgi:phospholipid/cholesterol/gamma-HCH transport system substrate-binding protein
VNGRSITAPLVKFLVFVVVTLLTTGLLAITIANRNLGSSTSYTADFTDATALNEGDDVRISGVKVGEVESIKVVDHRFARVTFDVSDRRLPVSTQAQLKYRNLVGQRYLALTPGTGDPNKFLPEDGNIPVSHTKPALDLTVLLGGFKPLFQALSPDDVNKLSFEIIQVLQGEGGTVQSLLTHTASLTSTIASKDQVIGQVVNNLNGVLGTVNNRDQQLSGLVVQLQQLVSGLSADRKPIGDAVSSLNGLTNTTAGLLQQARPPLKQDIQGLGQVSKNLNDNQAVTQRFLQNMPGKLDTITRTATHGSWFNFFLCKTSGTVGIGNANLPLPLSPVTEPRCKP